MPANWRLASRRKALVQRAAILQAIREFVAQRAYLEVVTPQRLPARRPRSPAFAE